MLWSRLIDVASEGFIYRLSHFCMHACATTWHDSRLYDLTENWVTLKLEAAWALIAAGTCEGVPVNALSLPPLARLRSRALAIQRKKLSKSPALKVRRLQDVADGRAKPHSDQLSCCLTPKTGMVEGERTPAAHGKRYAAQPDHATQMRMGLVAVKVLLWAAVGALLVWVSLGKRRDFLVN